MRLREYEYLLAIARERSMLRAAKALFVSQPALSRTLLRVEDELGAQLFERTGREMTLTSAGRIYIKNAEKIVELNRQIEENIRNGQPDHQKISVGYPMIRSDFFTNTLFPAFHSLYPLTPLSGHIHAQASLFTHLLHDDFSLAVGFVTEEYAQTLSYRLIGQEEMVLAVPKGHPLERTACVQEGCTYPFLHASALDGASFLMPRPNSYSGRFAQQYFHAHRLATHVCMQMTLTANLLPLIAKGAGIAILPSLPLHHMHLEDSITYLSIQKDAPLAVGVLFCKDHLLTVAEEAFVSLARKLYT